MIMAVLLLVQATLNRTAPLPGASIAAALSAYDRAARTTSWRLPAVAKQECDRARTLRVLFVGNSFTYVHNVPRLVAGVAASLPGPCIEASMIASGGATLEDHWRSDSVARRIRDGHWTHVVLNDQSTFGEAWWLEGRPRVGTSGRELAEFAGRFVGVIREAGATAVLLAHWADASAPARDQQALDHLFAEVARATHSTIAPAGQVIRRVQAALPAVTLYFSDNHHLSPAGAYVEALILYSALADRSPIGATRRIRGAAVELNLGTVHGDSSTTLVDLPDQDASRLQHLARSMYLAMHRRMYSVPKPAPLSAEFPQVPAQGDSLAPGALHGQWRGMSLVLPNPAGDSVAIEFNVSASTSGQANVDSLHLRAGPLHFAGLATLDFERTHLVVRAPVWPSDVHGRRPTQPLLVELRAVMHGGLMTGVASIQQRFAGSSASFDAIGRFEARRSDLSR